MYNEGLENYLEALFKPGGVFSADRVRKGMEMLRLVRSVLPESLKERINQLPNVLSENVPPPKVGYNCLLLKNTYRVLAKSAYDSCFLLIDRFNACLKSRCFAPRLDNLGRQSVRERSQIYALERRGRNQRRDTFSRRVQHNEKFHERTREDTTFNIYNNTRIEVTQLKYVCVCVCVLGVQIRPVRDVYGLKVRRSDWHRNAFDIRRCRYFSC